MVLLVMSTVWAYLRWRERPTAVRAGVVGVLAGWALVTRPLDAVCVLGPLVVLMVWESARTRGGGIALARTVAALAAGAVPFVVLQLALDRAVTGHALRTPWAFYQSAVLPYSTAGFAAPPEDVP